MPPSSAWGMSAASSRAGACSASEARLGQGTLVELETWEILVVVHIPGDEGEAVLECGGRVDQIERAGMHALALFPQRLSESGAALGHGKGEGEYRHPREECLQLGLGIGLVGAAL